MSVNDWLMIALASSSAFYHESRLLTLLNAATAKSPFLPGLEIIRARLESSKERPFIKLLARGGFCRWPFSYTFSWHRALFRDCTFTFLQKFLLTHEHGHRKSLCLWWPITSQAINLDYGRAAPPSYGYSMRVLCMREKGHKSVQRRHTSGRHTCTALTFLSVRLNGDICGNIIFRHMTWEEAGCVLINCLNTDRLMVKFSQKRSFFGIFESLGTFGPPNLTEWMPPAWSRIEASRVRKKGLFS